MQRTAWLIFVVSGDTRLDTLERAFRLGADAYFREPFVSLRQACVAARGGLTGQKRHRYETQ